VSSVASNATFVQVMDGQMGIGPVVFGPGNQLNLPNAGVFIPCRLSFKKNSKIFASAAVATQVMLILENIDLFSIEP